MKTSSLVLLAGVGFVAFTVMKARGGGTVARNAAPASTRYFGPTLNAFSAYSREANPVADGTLADNYMDLLFAPGGFYGG